MDIIHPDKHTFSLVRTFIEPYEEKCVLLCSYVRKEDKNIYIIVKNNSFNQADCHEGCPGTFVNSEGNPVSYKDLIPTDILGVIYIGSTLFHCIPEPFIAEVEREGQRLFGVLLKVMNGKKIKCVSGEAAGTDFFIRLFKANSKEAFQVNNYNLMTDEKLVPAPEPLCNGDEVIRCTENDMDRLKPVQKRYLQDEVAPKGKIVSDLEVSMTLRQILKQQLCLAVVSDGEIAAKANTNAIGMKWVQIGGVYTVPLYRRNGYAFHLIYTLCHRVLKVNKKVALFVKEKNIPAIELYKKLGFEVKGFYKIAYFN